MERSAARRKLDLPAEATVIAIVGRVSDWKGQRILAEALALEPLASTGAIGIVAGDAASGQEHFERELRELRERLRLGDRLRLLGFRDDLETVLGAADVFAAPATHPDALPNAVIEAAAAGVPVVGSEDGGGLPEILSDGVSGRLVPPRDPPALARALADLLGDREQARRLGAAAAAEVHDRFQVERMLEAVQACYEELG
jgi:glycosyltransferase involved in cell wall biosynthesis